MKVGIVGFGYVGNAIARYFAQAHQVFVFDKYKTEYSSKSNQDLINQCDIAFVSVPTATAADGWKCDLSELLEVFSWLSVPACIKSTVPPGTVSRLAKKVSLPIGFSPEFIGESEGHEWNEIDSCGFTIISGPDPVVALFTEAYRSVNQNITIVATSSIMAELCKYMENSFLATKVAFVNQFYDIAIAYGVDFTELASLWALDPRVGKSHCRVTPERGFGGKCLPKDIRAIIAAVSGQANTALLDAVVDYNEQIRAHSEATLHVKL